MIVLIVQLTFAGALVANNAPASAMEQVPFVSYQQMQVLSDARSVGHPILQEQQQKLVQPGGRDTHGRSLQLQLQQFTNDKLQMANGKLY